MGLCRAWDELQPEALSVGGVHDTGNDSLEWFSWCGIFVIRLFFYGWRKVSSFYLQCACLSGTDCGSEPGRCDMILIIMNNNMFIILTLFTVFDKDFSNCYYAICE